MIHAASEPRSVPACPSAAPGAAVRLPAAPGLSCPPSLTGSRARGCTGGSLPVPRCSALAPAPPRAAPAGGWLAGWPAGRGLGPPPSATPQKPKRQERYPPAAHGGPHAGAGGCPKEAVTPWEACTGAGSWQDLRTRGERSPRSKFSGRSCDPVGDPRWSSVLLKDCTPWQGPMLQQFMKNCSPWEGPTLEKFGKDCLPWEGPHAGAGEECNESCP
ncbi:uncharacterized protein LOC128139721 isoform X2 [Harpia harpyja]|uniref:uncharacterized protein LOC128139721 isoform X2 n=1 Tax=Harpia harpyja TaxID=202280 RepID=UPI0022B1CC25|nr:uncharacterized protein LOC128139721 isoform X2 [Harpia harpyja]